MNLVGVRGIRTKMNNTTYSLKIPRRVFIRKIIKFFGKSLLNTLAEVEINHPERLPRSGPIILVGNHTAATDAVMMAVLTPGIVEFIGTGDIPFDYLKRMNYGTLPRMGLKTSDYMGLRTFLAVRGAWRRVKNLFGGTARQPA